MPRTRALAALPLLALSLAACAGEPPPAAEAPPGPRVESPGLGIALAALPAGFEVEVNAGQELRLAATDRPGEVWLEAAAPRAGGVNLVAAVNDHKAAVEALPEGAYQGQIELMSPLGSAYASRGRFSEGGATVEEFRLFAVHPDRNRLLTVVYRYPAGDDSAERRDQLLTLLGEVEGLPAALPQP